MTRLRAHDAERRANNDAGPDFSEALARGLQVILAFNGDSSRMTLSDVARAVDLPRATVRRALLTLQHLGYAEADGRQFRLTPRVLRLASAYLSADAAATVIQPACEKLMRETGEICSAAVLDGDEIVMIARAFPAQLVQVGTGIGYRLPAYRSALGRVLLARKSAAELDAYLARVKLEPATPFTLTDPAAFRQELLAVARHGFSFADQEVEYGYRSLAVPLRRSSGDVTAALHISARVERATAEQMLGEQLPKLQEMASELQPLLI